MNDNAPVIELVDGRIRLYESAELGSELYVGAARDADSQRYGIDSCQLTPNSVQSATNTTAAAAHVTAFFALVVRRRLDDVRVVDLYVRLTSKLDRETFGDSLVSMACRMSVNQSDAITCLYTRPVITTEGDVFHIRKYSYNFHTILEFMRLLLACDTRRYVF